MQKSGEQDEPVLIGWLGRAPLKGGIREEIEPHRIVSCCAFKNLGHPFAFRWGESA
jgi:hypothetical protein